MRIIEYSCHRTHTETFIFLRQVGQQTQINYNSLHIAINYIISLKQIHNYKDTQAYKTFYLKNSVQGSTGHFFEFSFRYNLQYMCTYHFDLFSLG